MPSRITATVGSRCTENSVNGVPNVERVSFTRGMASEERPCTKSTCFVFSSNCLLNSLSFPAPKRIRLAVANSKEDIFLALMKRSQSLQTLSARKFQRLESLTPLPVGIFGEDIRILDSVPGFSEHL